MTRLDPGAVDLPTLTSLAGVAVNEYLLARLRALGHGKLRISHGYVFQHLIEGPRSVGELARLLGVTQQAASKSALELESLGYVERRSDGDARVKRLALTPRGHSAIEGARAERARLEVELRAEVGARGLGGARRALLSLLELTGGLEAVASRRVKPPSP